MPSLSVSELKTLSTIPQIRAALDTIAWAEGGAYNRLFGGGTFSGNQHPNICIKFGRTCSTAAGRYQFLFSTWNEIKNRVGLPNFSPENQDLAAIDLINQKGQISNLLIGNFTGFLQGLGCTWAALPFNGRKCSPAQTEKNLSSTLSFYENRLNELKGSASTVSGNSTNIIDLGQLATVNVPISFDEDKKKDSTSLGLLLALVALVVILR